VKILLNCPFTTFGHPVHMPLVYILNVRDQGLAMGAGLNAHHGGTFGHPKLAEMQDVHGCLMYSKCCYRFRHQKQLLEHIRHHEHHGSLEASQCSTMPQKTEQDRTYSVLTFLPEDKALETAFNTSSTMITGKDIKITACHSGQPRAVTPKMVRRMGV